MFCCKLWRKSTQQISPSDSSTAELNLVHKFIKLKHNKLIHLTHVNGKKTTSTPPRRDSKSFEPTSLNTLNVVEQPKLGETTAKVTYTLEPDSSSFNTDSSSMPPQSDINSKETFTNLLSNAKFKQRNQKYMTIKDGFDSLGFSILYKNKIKISTLSSINSNLISESRCAMTNSNKLPVLFYIHGVGGNCNIWQKQIEFFGRKNYEIIALDLIGHGQSNVPNEFYNYQFLEMALDLLLVFDMFASQEENVIIGHSYGKNAFKTIYHKNSSSLRFLSYHLHPNKLPARHKTDTGRNRLTQ
jgi:hypothetical protein